jgi:hypothetical protein
MRDDELLRRYFLGDLSDDEKEGLERRLIEDEPLSQLAEAIEDEVLEDYDRGELQPDESARVARHLAGSPSSRLRLAVIRGLAAIAAEQATRGRLLPFPRPDLSQPGVRAAALAAMLVMAVGSTWLAFQTAPPVHPVVAGAPAPTPTPRSAVPPVTPTPPPVIAEKEPIQPPVRPSLRTFVQALSISASRGGEEGVPEVRVPAGFDRVELHLLLGDGNESYRSFRVDLRALTEEKVILEEDLRPRETSEGQALVLTLDASRLREGRYLAEVRGVTADGSFEDIGFPEFQVHKR